MVDTSYHIYMYYNGSERGSLHFTVDWPTGRVVRLEVCDVNRSDNISPRLRLQRTSDDEVFEYRDEVAGSACYIRSLNMNAERYRGLFRNTSTGSISHGMVWSPIL